jgi:hypothetical protein
MLSMAIFKKTCWHTIKEDIYKKCFQFYDGKLNMASITMGHTILIPKVAVPEGFNDTCQLLC